MALTSKQNILARYMSGISERCYCAGWMIGLENRLWSAVTDPTDDRRYGMDEITVEEIEAMSWLSEQLGGWIRWDEDTGKVFVPLAEWKANS